MLQEAAQYLLNQLMDDYKPSKWPVSAVKSIIPDLLKEPGQAAELAYSDLLRKNNRLPTIDAVLKCVQFHGNQVRMAEARDREAQAAKDRACQPKALPQGQSDFGKAASALISDLLNGKMSRRDYLKSCARLADQYQREELAEMVMREWEKLPPEYEAA